ncbi:unknown protein [Oryza sativa Japonica Group]|uniref:Uncharacterized protein n=1 Tax=Oryza sativa subsp. japonica TaxID=39947 RepID=Q5JK01_ORYSJ|nr:unknown protein [Oryza sativa Japonica Group]
MAKAFSPVLNLANLAEEVQIAYWRRINLKKDKPPPNYEEVYYTAAEQEEGEQGKPPPPTFEHIEPMI